MAKTFAITTTATDTLKTDAKGHAEAVFTVTNTTARPVRGMARAKALESTKQEWLQITGETERDFAPGATQQFVVTFDSPIAAPPAGPTTAAPKPATPVASADQYSFRLDVSSATNPDEDFTEGPVVKLQLPTAVAPATPSKFPKWLIPVIAVVVLLVVGLVLWLVLRNRGPEVYELPDVATATASDAQQSLESGCPAGAGCVVVEVSPIADNTAAKDTAIRTDPAAGTGVAIGSKVTLFISTGPEAAASPLPTPPPETYKLPAVANQPEDNAKKLLAGNCKTMDPCVDVEVNRVNDNKVPSGTVIRTDPKEGTEVQAGTKVTMFVSKGPDKVTILSVANLPADAARDKLEKSCGATDCLDVEANIVSDNTVPSGHVIRTDPAAGIEVAVGSRVKMFVSGGTDQVMIPAVRNLLVADAVNKLAKACNPSPCLKVVQTNRNDDLIAAGRALGTNPAFGMVKIGSSVVLNVSNGPEIRVVGNYKGLSEQQARQKIVSDGFTVGTVTRVPMFNLPARVYIQVPATGSKLLKGGKVNFSILGSL